ncbi:MAG: aquaporin [Defluviitaleaceae bacterium]|nr:aquaporin [Defluviitaleaceae bacterium]MCL2274524.1 aquaporin [Defluviitaleaceae bacterium]
MSDVKKFPAEALGTFVLTFMGCGAAVVLGASTYGGHLAVALAFGLSIVAMAYTIGSISGCHINPAVSLGVFLDGRMSLPDFIGYVIAQVIGAIAGGGLLFALVEIIGITDHTGGLGSNGVANAGGIGGALIIEVVLTFIFILVILSVTANEKMAQVAGIVIALTLTFVHIVGIPLTGTSVNPARSLGPAIFAGGTALSDVWVFIVAPLVGAMLAVLVYRGLVRSKD